MKNFRILATGFPIILTCSLVLGCSDPAQEKTSNCVFTDVSHNAQHWANERRFL